MKALALMLATFLALGVAAVPAFAQAPSGSPGASPGASTEAPAAARPDQPSSADVDVKADVRTESRPAEPAPGAERRPGVSVDIEQRDESAAALPRGAATDRGAVFGLSPTAAVIVGAALLIVVILAIVAMTRSGATTYVDRDR
jgi:cobalamin biosynthesis Mg chelatase CobN